MVLLYTHAEIPSCSDCQKWVYDPETWKQTTYRGQPLARPPGQSPPCWKCPKSTDRATPNPAAELSDAGWAALHAYYRIKGGQPMPADDLVAWYCGLFRWAEDLCERQRTDQTGLLLGLGLLTRGTGSKR